MKIKTAIIILALFHVAGLIAILFTSYRDFFLSLTPLNLLVSFSLLFYFHKNFKNIQFFIFVGIAIIGFFAEVLGVLTGSIFGSYFYGSVLGWKFLNTPLIIGVNWIMLTYAAVYSWSKYVTNTWLIAFLSATTLVLLDFLIEPVAISYDFWLWKEDVIPNQNYVAWFAISFFFCFFLEKCRNKSTNSLAPYLLITQFIFFGVFCLFN